MAPSAATADYVEGPRHGAVTSENVGAIISIVTLLFMVTMILAVILRVLVRFTTSLVPGADDAVVLFALFAALGEVIAISLSVRHGLGMRSDLLSSAQLAGIQRGVYAASLFYILTIGLGKMSTLLLLHRLTISAPHELTVAITAGAILAWTLAALFGAAFQCNLPDPWNVRNNRCFDIVTFWDILGAFDILIDLSLIAFPVWVVWRLQMPLRRKAVVVTGFAFRILLCAAQATRLAFLNRLLHESNPSYLGLGYILAMQFHTTLAVVVACIPAYKLFMDRTDSGLMGISLKGRESTYQLSSVNKSGENSKQGSREAGESYPRRVNGYRAEISANDVRQAQADRAPHRTVKWEVHHSDDIRLNPRIGRLPSEGGSNEQGTDSLEGRN